MGAVAKSYMRKGFLIYEEIRKNLVIYEDEEAFSHIWLCNRSRLNVLIYEENLIFFFSVRGRGSHWKGATVSIRLRAVCAVGSLISTQGLPDLFAGDMSLPQVPLCEYHTMYKYSRKRNEKLENPQSRQSVSFFSSRRKWDSPNPSPAGECALPPPPGSGGRGTLAGERGVGRVSIPTRGHTLWYSLYTVNVLCERTVGYLYKHISGLSSVCCSLRWTGDISYIASRTKT
jgi:hypothetical protein